MELIINLIIVLVIIFSVLKRIQDVAKKEPEIKGKKPPPPKPLPELIKELQRQFEPPVPRETERSFEPPTVEKHVYEPVPQQISEPVPEFRAEPVSEPAFQEEFTEYPQIDETVQEPVQEVMREKTVPPKRYREPVLHFNASAVVNGIIMSEILGQPVSMRKDASPVRW